MLNLLSFYRYMEKRVAVACAIGRCPDSEHGSKVYRYFGLGQWKSAFGGVWFFLLLPKPVDNGLRMLLCSA